MSARRLVTDRERRARLVARHHLRRTADSVTAAVRGVVALHSTDPATPYLGARARVPDFRTGDLDQALHEDRTVWRLHAMRRTLFVVPTDEAPVFEAAAGRAVARKERARLEGWLAAEMDPTLVPGWVADAEARVLEALADGERRTQELTAAVPELGIKVTLGSGKWSARSPVSSRLLFVMALDGRIVRTRPAGTWRSSQYRWAATHTWFADPAEPMDEGAGRVKLARRYLRAHGPATVTDLRWWTGWTVRQAGEALERAGASSVALESGGEGHVLADDDTRDVEIDAPTVALLPALDSTPMGWKERDWYSGPDTARLWDRNGNVGPTVWVDGRIVGGWGQRPGGEVVYQLLDDVGDDASKRVAQQAAELTGWMDGVAVIPRFRTPLERELSA